MESSPMIMDDDDDSDDYDDNTNGNIYDDNDKCNYDNIVYDDGNTDHNADGTIAERTWEIDGIYLWLLIS